MVKSGSLQTVVNNMDYMVTNLFQSAGEKSHDIRLCDNNDCLQFIFEYISLKYRLFLCNYLSCVLCLGST